MDGAAIPSFGKLPGIGALDKIFTDNFKINKRKLEKVEEEEDDDPAPLPTDPKIPKFNKDHLKSMIIATKKVNCLDDLSQLLKNSEKYQKARMASRITAYRDPDFPTELKSLIGFQMPRDLPYYQSLKWLRPKEFFRGSGKIAVYDDIEPDDIIQGALGDCYFLAACSSIANKPERLERLFLSGGEYNRDGLHAVAICLNGIWEEILLDDQFPCTPVSKKPAFNTSKQGELWVMMLEKAWAKVHDGYLNISAGLTREALRDLTGACAKTFFTEKSGAKKEELWDVLVKSHQKGHIMCAGSDDLSGGSDAYIEKIGICGSHAYSVLGVFEVSGNQVLPLGSSKNRCIIFIFISNIFNYSENIIFNHT